MQCKSCGANWFVEERLVRPAGIPRTPQNIPLPNQEQPWYQYRCSTCGLIYGEEPQPNSEPTVKSKAGSNPVSKKQGRPPKRTGDKNE